MQTAMKRERPMRMAGVHFPEDPEDDFFFGRKTPQSCNWGDIEAISTELPTPYRNG
jgi:hypothetical protein